MIITENLKNSREDNLMLLTFWYIFYRFLLIFCFSGHTIDKGFYICIS